MLYRISADAVLLFHLGFVLFVIAGGLLMLRWRRVVWAHAPAAAWGVMIQFAGWTCPLTPLENQLRFLGGQAGYSGGFIEHYLLSVLYPSGLTPQVQLAMGVALLLLNAGLYAALFPGRERSRLASAPPADERFPQSA